MTLGLPPAGRSADMPAVRGEGPLLVAEQIGKTFPGVRALEAVNFDVRPGEIHALLGQNGAGKSTLMNIIAGVIQHDVGRLFVNGAPVVIRGPLHAQSLGISIVHQELSLFPSRNIAENIFVGRLPTQNGFVDHRKLLADARASLATLKMDLDPRTLIRDLPFSQQQVIEIAKALSFGGRLLILDEPASALTEHESAILFRHLRRLRAQGMGIIYVSHRLREVFELNDRITVLRDGRLVGTFAAGEVTQAQVVDMMVSRSIAAVAKPADTSAGPVSLSVRGLSVGRTVRGIDLELHRGEILGLAGLAGGGQAEIGRALGGLIPRRADSITLDGVPVRGQTPRDAMRSGIVYLPADRRGEGLFLGLDVQQNIVASSLKKLRIGPWMDDREAGAVAGGFVASLAVRTPSLHQRVANLSGGNQQKVVLARGLTVDARIFIADEPTRGIDVGAKAEIYGLLRRLADAGKSVLLISAELPELLAMSDRVLVIASGEIAGELTAAEATEAKVMMLSSSQLDRATQGVRAS